MCVMKMFLSHIPFKDFPSKPTAIMKLTVHTMSSSWQSFHP